jgi:hypothetical protein
MKLREFFLLFCCLSLTGCWWWQNPEELERLTKEDPVFKQMIVARDQAHAQEHLIKEDLLAKKRILDGQTEKLRAEYDAYAKAQNKKVEQCQSAIESNRELLKRQIETASAELEARQKDVEEYDKTLSGIKKLLRESKGISFSGQEKQKLEEKALILSEKIRPLADQVQELKLQIRLKKQKIQFLT